MSPITKDTIRSGGAARVCAPALLTSLLLAGCAVGPDFKKPDAPQVAGYTPQPLASATAGAATEGGDVQHLVAGRDIPGDWWTLFHSEPLNALIVQSLANNPDLKAAQAALVAAHENTLSQEGAYFPSVNAGFSASRQMQPGSLAPVPANNELLYNLFTPQVSVSYTPDVFGLNQRTVESLAAQEDATRYQALATYNTLTANVAVTAIQLGAAETEIDAIRALVADNAKMQEILQYQFDKRYASGADLAAQKSQAAQAAAMLPPLIKQQAQLRDQLADLAGRFPSQAPTGTFALSSLQLPQDIPVSLPSQLVAQRPDVLQAEANLHAASAEIGVAVANRLPNIELTANAGSTALAINQVFASGTGFWGIGAALAAPIFDGGALLHKERAARAAYDQAAAQYRSTVLTAFQNVADTLAALETDADGLKAAAAADAAAKTTLDIAERQARDGYASTLTLLNAEQAYRQAHVALVQAEAARFADTAALFQALGGGWWHRTDLARNDHDN